MNKQLVRKYISVIRRACDLLEQQLEEDVSQAFEEIAGEASPVRAVLPPKPAVVIAPAVHETPSEPEPEPPPAPPVNTEEEKQHRIARAKHVSDLMGIECWPAAIPQFQADAKPTEEDMINRANAVLDMCLGTSVEQASFLDYGCGDGYIAAQMALRGPSSITGYDIVPSETWQRLGSEKVNYTADTNSLEGQGYDILFLYDVLDHAVDPECVMKHVKYLAKPGSLVYVRCHPWTSKHASHLPKVGLNKAYIHMFLTFEELVERGFKPLFTRIETNPLEAYRWWFRDFKIVNERPIYDDVSEFFHVQAFKELLANEQQIPMKDIDAFLDRMRLQFVDFTLEA